jgi:biofilm PGA synthesis protein PgaD
MIIENTQLQSTTVKSVWLSITLFLWFVYVYLWLPLISLVAWWLGYKTFVHHMIDLNGILGFKHLLINYLIFIVALCGFLIAWANLEQLRFKNKTRRRGAGPLEHHAVARYFNVDEAKLRQMQSFKTVTVEFNHQGEMTGLRSPD